MSTMVPPSSAGPSPPPGPPQVPTEMARQVQLIRSGANWFIWIAGLSLVNSVLFAVGSNWAFFLGLGATQFVDAFGKEIITGTTGQVLALVVDVVIHRDGAAARNRPADHAPLTAGRLPTPPLALYGRTS